MNCCLRWMVCDANFVTQMWPTGPQQMMCHPLQFLPCHVILRLLPSNRRNSRVNKNIFKPFVSMISSKVWEKSVFYTSHTIDWQDSALAILTSDPRMATGCMQVSSALKQAVCNRSMLSQDWNVFGLIGSSFFFLSFLCPKSKAVCFFLIKIHHEELFLCVPVSCLSRWEIKIRGSWTTVSMQVHCNNVAVA